jgi:hypothetical protein
MPKQERIPELKDVDPTKPNRRQRRHPEHVEDTAVSHDAQPDEPNVGGNDDPGVRAKSSGHKMKAAGNWNQ